MLLGARDYDPMVGRWVSKDPILFEGDGPNLYRYAGNDPVNFRDPTGRFLVAVAVPVADGLGWMLWQAYQASKTYDEAVTDAQRNYGSALHNTPGDAYKHCLASCLVAQRQGNLVSATFGEANEIKGDLKGQPSGEHLMDDVNNACGRSYAPGNCQQECAMRHSLESCKRVRDAYLGSGSIGGSAHHSGIRLVEQQSRDPIEGRLRRYPNRRASGFCCSPNDREPGVGNATARRRICDRPLVGCRLRAGHR